MKKINILLLIMLSAFLLISCEHNNTDDETIPVGGTKMSGVVTDVGDRIAILVSEGAYKDQPIHVLINSNTSFLNKNGNKTTKDSINIGDKIDVTFSGQVMMSYPGQISAIKIEIK